MFSQFYKTTFMSVFVLMENQFSESFKTLLGQTKNRTSSVNLQLFQAVLILHLHTNGEAWHRLPEKALTDI